MATPFESSGCGNVWMHDSKPWFGLPVPVDTQARQISNASVMFHIGDGGLTCFWYDSWLLNRPLKDVMADLFANCPKQNLSIRDALVDDQ
jgi:hypothetical protein